MTNTCHSPIDLVYCLDSRSDLSLFNTSRPFENTVPIGTVACRIVDLQNLVNSTSSKRPQPPLTYHRENSRTGFGRRVSARFAQPASISSKPEEQPQVDVKHAFLGLAARRANHTEEHAVVDGRTKWDRTSGLHAQLQPSGLGARVQYEATSPWGILPTGKLNEDLCHKHDNQESSATTSGGTAPHLNSAPAVSFLAVSPANDGAEGALAPNNKESSHAPDLWARCAASHQRKPDSSSERVSIETTSTIRRRSVRDLYHYHGIQRPARLVSSENFASDPEETPELFHKYRYCHICYCINGPDSTCCKCGHALCHECESITCDRLTKVNSANCITLTPTARYGQLKGDARRNKTLQEKMGKQAPCKDRLSSRRSPCGQLRDHEITGCPAPNRGLRRSSLSGDVPSLRLERVSPSCETEKTVLAHFHLSDSIGQAQVSIVAPEPPTLLAVSPHFVPDTILLGYSLGLLHVVTGLDHQQRQPDYRSAYRGRNLSDCSSNSYPSSELKATDDIDFCRSAKCHATPSGHHDHCGGSACIRKRRRHPEETDSGYAAGVSHLDEPESCPHGSYVGAGNPSHNHHSTGGHEEFLQLSRQNSTYSGKNRDDIRQNEQLRGNSTPQRETDRPQEISQNRYPSCLLERQSAHPRDTLPNPVLDAVHKSHQMQNHHIGSSAASGYGRCEPYPQDGKHDPNQSERYNDCSFSYDDHCSISTYHSAAREKHVTSLRTQSQHQSLTTIPGPSEKVLLGSTDHLKTPVVASMPQRRRASLPWLRNVFPVKSQGNIGQGFSASVKQQSSKDNFMALKGIFEQQRPPPPPLSVTKKISSQPIVPSQTDTKPKPQSAQNGPVKAAEIPGDAIRKLSSDESQPESAQRSGTFSPSESKPTSRRLSAFFKLQEQNIASVLNKRLQEHQEELRRIEKMCDEQLNVSALRGSLIHKHKDLEKEVKRIEPGTAPNATGKRQEDMKHEFKWKSIVLESRALSSNVVNPPARLEVEGDVGINGITVIVHLDGREDIVIKTDLNPAP